jgi:uncharacterized membrane protein
MAIQLVVALVSIVYTLFHVAAMPETVPVHWGPTGQPDGYGSKYTVLGLTLFLSLVIPALTVSLPKISPSQKPLNLNDPAYLKLMTFIGVMMTLFAMVTLTASATPKSDPTRPIMILMGWMFAGMGPMLSDIKPNYYAGIRTPWTLSSNAVWKETHRRSAFIFTIGGIATTLLAVITPWPVLGIIPVLVASFGSVIDSYFVYQRLK